MADISVNVRGRDDGFGSMLDSLRDKASSVGREMGSIGDNFNNLTKTEKRIELERANTESTDLRKQSVRSEYQSIRESNKQEFNQASDDYANKRISRKEFEAQKKTFEQLSTDTDRDENDELTAIEKESNSFLKEILKQLQLQERLDAERRQRDGSEYAEGSIGSLLSANSDLRRRQSGSTDDDEIAALQAEIDANNANIRGMRNNGREVDDEGGGGSNIRGGLMQSAGSAARGDISGTLMGGATAIGGAAIGIGLVAMIVKEFMSHGEKIQNAIGQSSAMRGAGGGYTARDYNSYYQSEISGLGKSTLGPMGISGEQFAEMVNQKAQASGMAGNDLIGRTLRDAQFQKSFGADAGMFSQFERFNEGQKTSTEISMDVLNVLTSIEKSSLKEGDLSTLAEKLQSQNAILSFQRNKRDNVDSDSALRTLAAYESAGLSQKGEKAGEFLNQTMSGLGEGGSDNAMLFKYEAAKRAHPELANDPAALRRLVKFRSDDPKYQAEFFKFAKQISGGSQMAEDDILYTMFNPQSEADMDIYKRMMENKGGARSTLTKTLDKTRKATLGMGTMTADAGQDTGNIKSLELSFSNAMQEFFVKIKTEIFNNPIKTMDVTPKPPAPNTKRAGTK